MAAVLFADLVGYSRKAVTDQMAAKEELREFLQAALAPVAAAGRVVVDTGDGAAMAFLADPEHALYVALRLRHDLEAAAGRGLLLPADLRLGINLGPVRRIVDVNGRPNLVGEGMNSAERVMSFSSPGEMTASRSYCDAVSCLHASYQQLFEPMGERADKHGRRHEIFRIVASERALEAAAASLDVADEPVAARTGSAPASAASRDGTRSRARRAAIAAGVIGLIGAGIVAWPLLGGGDETAGEVRSAPVTAAVPGAGIAGTPPAPPTAAQAPPLDERTPAPAVAEPPAPAGEIALQENPPASVAEPSAPAPTPREVAKAPRPPRPAVDAANAPRCASLLQRAAVGERLTSTEREELKTSCR